MESTEEEQKKIYEELKRRLKLLREDILTTELQKVSSESQRRELYSMDWLDDKDKIIEGAFAECYLKCIL